MKTHFLLGESIVKAEVHGGNLVFDGTDKMILAFTNLRDKRLRKVQLYLAGGIELKLERADGWQTIIRGEAEGSQQLVIIRHQTGNGRKKQRQYLSAGVQWLSYPRGESALPADALKLPIFAP